jgi:hypothetical protein
MHRRDSWRAYARTIRAEALECGSEETVLKPYPEAPNGHTRQAKDEHKAPGVKQISPGCKKHAAAAKPLLGVFQSPGCLGAVDQSPVRVVQNRALFCVPNYFLCAAPPLQGIHFFC